MRHNLDPDQLIFLRPLVVRYIARKCGSQSQAEDITQEALENALRYAHTFDPQKASAAAWLCTIARNIWVRRYARDARQGITVDATAELTQIAASGDDPGMVLEKSELIQTLSQALLSLPEPERTIIRLKYFEKKKLSEIAVSVDLSERTITRKVTKAYEMLRKVLEGAGWYDET
ncbi:MAG: sigma-70 family RNA polymerase sigma factor [Spirochaetales bacterium]|nr:sigma-70 family RNA polymerase sigma factor [Spirochaetales bacterium]